MSDLDAYRSLYIAESRENHETIVKNLLILENGPDENAIAEIFRSAHSLKGMSASMGFEGMERICHAMEDVFQEIRSGKLDVNPDLMDVLLSGSDLIESMLDDIENGGDGISDDLDDTVKQLKNWTSGNPAEQGVPAPSPGNDTLQDIYSQHLTDAPDTGANGAGTRYRITVRLQPDCHSKNIRGMIVLQNLEELGHIECTSPSRGVIEDGEFDGSFIVDITSDAGEEALRVTSSIPDVSSILIENAAQPVILQPAGIQKQSSVHEKGSGPEKTEKTDKSDKGREVKNIRVDITRLDQMMNLVEDLVINRGRITQISRKYQIKELDETLNMVGRSVSDLQNLMMNIRMIPLNHIFNRFPRTVRDVAHKEGKEVEFIIEGGETELDRSVMDGLNDPLLHLIRNGIDHGIELPEIRLSQGKAARGLLKLSARRDRDNVIITIEDDGAGISAEKVLAKAQKNGLISPEEAEGLSQEEIFEMLFLPGFSTADKITDISGRGVGLDVVKNAIDSVKGTIKVESGKDKGTKFELLLPPTMAIVNVMMVRINEKRCAIPVNNVVEVASLTPEKIHHIGTNEMVLLREELLPLDRLDDMFGKSEKSEILVVLSHQNKKRSIAVDLIEGQQEVVIKPLSSIVGMCRGVSGVTIPGDGEVVPVLDVNSVIKET